MKAFAPNLPGVTNPPFAAQQSFNDPTSNDPNAFASWKGGCGREPMSSTAILISSASKTGNTVTATTAAANKLTEGDTGAQIFSMFNAAYNSPIATGVDDNYVRVFDVGVGGPNTFKYNLFNTDGSPNTTGSGTSCATAAICKGNLVQQPWGSWGYQANANTHSCSHTYKKILDTGPDAGKSGLPDRVCVNFYDVHGGGTTQAAIGLVKGASEITVDANGDNSVQTNDFDVNNGANCITIQQSAIVTTATDTTLGGNIHDTAALSGVGAGVTGNLVFKAYKRTGASPDCSGVADFNSGNVPTTGSGNFGSGDFTPGSAGTYDWLVTWTSNDPLILGATSVCGDQNGGNDETSDVGKKQPAVTTDGGPDVTLDISGTTNLTDSATLSGAYLPLGAAATITFQLFADDGSGGCGTQIGTDSVKSITTNGSVSSDPRPVTAPGTYHWIANFSGDDNNFSTSNVCNNPDGHTAGHDENVVVSPRGTSLTTDAGGPYTFNLALGNDLFDIATLAGGTSDATGTLTFTLWSNTACDQTVGITGSNTATATVSQAGGGADSAAYTSSPGVHVVLPSTYHWKVHYSGDSKNNASDSLCLATNENPQVLNPGINIEKTPDNQTIETGTKATFTITVSNNGAVALTDVKVDDPNSPDCDRTAAQIVALLEAKYPPAPHTSMGTGESVSYNCDSPTQTTNSTFHNVATTEGKSQGVTVTDSDSADVKIIHPQIDVQKDPKSQSVPLNGTANFTILVTNTGDSPLSGIVITDAQATGCSKTAAETAAYILAQDSHAEPLQPTESFTYTCSKSLVTAPFLNVIEACGNDELTNQTCDTDTDNGGPPGCPEAARCGSVTVSGITTKQDFLPKDTATISGLAGTPGGSLTFSLFKGPGCDAANQLDLNSSPGSKDLTAAVNANGSYPVTSDNYLAAMLGSPDTAGTFNWLVSYSGDAQGNSAITGTCGTEHFTVDNG